MTDERARLFVALELPEIVVQALIQWRSAAVGEVAGLRLGAPEGLHVTLCFLGSVPVEDVEAVGQACRRGAARCARFGLGLGEAVWLPSPRRPRVLAVGLDNVGGGLAVLQTSLAGVLADGGWYEPEDRPFRPHVTVARVRGGARVQGFDVPRPAPVQFVASEVVLMRSWLGGGEGRAARYERVAVVSLGVGAP